MLENAQLYLKTRGLPGPELQYFGVEEVKLLPNQPAVPFNFVPREGPTLPGIIIDQRDLKAAEIAELYYSAHAFLFPSMGEGWGLTLSDALATGLPSIWTHRSAMLDYAEAGHEGEIGYPIRDFDLVRMKFIDPTPPGAFVPEDNRGAEVSINSIIQQIEALTWNYPEALRRGRRPVHRDMREGPQ
jgi:glycosyltransferase involved in cell wall biosynthesis